jgi:signal transduction histidine kinase
MAAAFAAQAGVALELAASRADAERLSLYEDRDRIACDLHDQVIQRLYATGMSLEGAMPMITRPEVASRVNTAVDAMDQTIKDIRGTIFALQARGTVARPDLRGDIVGAMLTIQVTGNGCGIPAGGRRSGLRNLADRAEKPGGTLRLSPADPAAPAPGTRLEWRVPSPGSPPG